MRTIANAAFVAFLTMISICVAVPLGSVNPGDVIRTETTKAKDMRGFGRVATSGASWEAPQGKVSRLDFICQNAEAARIVASKYMADLLGYGAVSKSEAVSGVPGTVLTVRHGGTWLLALEGNRAIVLSGPTHAALRVFAPDAKDWQAVPDQAYPRYLDNFDNAGLGLWWMATSKTDEQLAWTESMPVAINLHSQTLAQNPAAGVVDMRGTDNSLAQIHAMGKPYRHMLWTGQPPWHDAKMMPGHHNERYPDGAIGRRFFEATGYNSEQVASPEVKTIAEAAMVAMMRQRVDDPDLLGWMEPHGEFHLSDPQNVPPGYETRFPAYLQLVKHYTLETISEAYTGDRQAYTSWSSVPYPDTAWFAGRRGHVVDLDDIPWRWKPATLTEGEPQGWTAPDFNDNGWRLNKRTDRIMLSQWDSSRVSGLWLRFTHSVPAELIANSKTKPIYLHICPYTEGDGRKTAVWINGQEVARDLYDPRHHQNRHIQMDVSSVLKAGDNDFVIHSNGGRISYKVFLSDTPGESFPYSDPQINQRYLDWRDYTTWEKLQTLTEFLKVMRSVDPVRPIKVMTPHLFQSEAFNLFERFGAYPQLTGEGGGWYRPMHYKGYSRLYGIPGSSEPGGAAITARSSQAMFAHILWEAQDCHDYVFDLARELWSHPEALEWWTNHKPLLSTIGKVDFTAPQVGLLRDVDQHQRFGNGGIWNWDLSRGPLPSLGLTPVLIDGGAMVEGRADDVPVILDCATIIMEPDMVDAIHRYVQGGGIFIAQHHTGEHTPQAKHAWPLATSFGLEVSNRFVNKENVHRWPIAPIHFTQEQTLFPSLRGKSAEGSGVAIDYKDNEYTGAIGISGKGDNVIPIATWDDGTMAVTEVREGYGCFILIGTPFTTRFKDEMGKWINEESRQKLLEDLLAGVGVERQTDVTDPRIWFERRASKNGLYDVYLAGATGIRDKEWTFEDTITTKLTAKRATDDPAAVDPTLDGMPDIPIKAKNGEISFGKQSFEPYQIRQFAVVRDDAGLEGPLHWLNVQQRAWRALEPVSRSLADAVTAEAAKIATAVGETGLDLSKDWAIQADPEGKAQADISAWLASPLADDSRTADLGAWRTQGLADATTVRYRKQVTLDPKWIQDGRRMVLGMSSFWQFGLCDSGNLWLNGRQLLSNHRGMFELDITDSARAAKGVLDLAIEVTSKSLNQGPIGTLYLRGFPAATATLEPTALQQVTDWGSMGGSVSLPIKQKIFGIEASFDVPADWAGHTVRLVVESDKPGRQFGGCIVNDSGLFRTEAWAPIGPQVDRWLIPGQTNRIQVYAQSFMSTSYDGFNADITNIYLEVSP